MSSVTLKVKHLNDSGRAALRQQYGESLDEERDLNVEVRPELDSRTLDEVLDEFGKNVRPEDIDELYAAIDEGVDMVREERLQERLKAGQLP